MRNSVLAIKVLDYFSFSMPGKSLKTDKVLESY